MEKQKNGGAGIFGAISFGSVLWMYLQVGDSLAAFRSLEWTDGVSEFVGVDMVVTSDFFSRQVWA